MKINVPSGRHVLDGWVNVDIVVSDHPKCKGPPQILADMRSIPLPDECADEVMSIHGIEHLLPWHADEALKEWYRLLKSGGLLVIECPDLMKCCKNIVEGYTVPGKHPDQFGMWGLFGDNRLQDEFMMHRFAYTPQTLGAKLHAVGYQSIQSETPQWHNSGKSRRDMRITARKPA